jgi:hypothetical protein
MTAKRLGAKEVSMICLEKRNEMPAHEWEIQQAEDEGIVIHNAWGPMKFIGDSENLSGIVFKKCTEVFDSNGKFNPKYDEAETVSMDCDHCLVTIGQKVDSDLFAEFGSLKMGGGGTIKIENDFATGMENVFAAGDAVLGPSSVIDAIAEGKKAADIIDRRLGGSGVKKTEKVGDEDMLRSIPTSDEIFYKHRKKPVISDVSERISDFRLIEQTYDEPTAVAEASRCLQCQMRLGIKHVVLPPERWIIFDRANVEAVPEVEGVIQLLDENKKAVRIVGSANIQKTLTECLEDPGDIKWFVWEEDPMFTKRESELIQQHLQKYGEMPGGGDDDLDDLF